MPIASDEMVEKFKAENPSAYREWISQEGLSIIDGHYVPDLKTLELRPWKRRGGFGVYINHEASSYGNDCYVCEIPAGGKLEPQRQLFEETIYVLSGSGASSVWYNDGKRIRFEWQTGSLFSVPLNAWHQHHNLSGVTPVRFVSSTNGPIVLNLYRDPEFVFRNPYEFRDRFADESDYFNGEGVQRGYIWETNFVSDLRNLPLNLAAKERGAGGKHLRFTLAGSSQLTHISEFGVGTYKKGHRHGPGAQIVIVSGHGYSLMWPEGSSPRRYDWQPGSLVIPPDRWFHQHFNTGSEPARYLALKFEGTMDRNEQGVPNAWFSQKEGGQQVNYADEDPMIREMFEKSLAINGIQSRMNSSNEFE